MTNIPIIKALNWHITDRCNYHCRFCFARRLGDEPLTLVRAKEILCSLREHGIEKINFAGGEPLLHPLLIDLLELSHDLGFVNSVVTNGSLVDEDFIERAQPVLDWVGISIDSSKEEVESHLGRGYGHHVANTIRACSLIRSAGIALKVNTVVTRANYQEDLTEMVKGLDPIRWKVFQCLHIEGQNDDHFDELSITKEQFDIFKERHGSMTLRGGAKPVFEENEDMLESYLMLGPSGDLFTNKGGRHTIIPFDIIDSKGPSAIVDCDKYIKRGGNYRWDLTKPEYP